MATEHLRRSRDDRVIAGVAGGLARYLDVDPLLVRLLFVLLTITFGAGILAYIAAIIIIPEDKEKPMDEQEPTPGTAEAPDTGASPASEPVPAPATVAASSASNPFLAPSAPTPPNPPDTPSTGATPAEPATAPVDAAPVPPVAVVAPVATMPAAPTESIETAPPATPPPMPPITPPPAPPIPPSHSETHDEEHRRRRMAFGLVLIFLGILFLFQQFVPAFDWGRFWPVLLIGLGAYLLLRERD